MEPFTYWMFFWISILSLTMGIGWLANVIVKHIEEVSANKR